MKSDHEQDLGDNGGGVDFATFVISLGTSAMLHLGAIPVPEGENLTENLPLARQTIDILSMLQQKTRGNLEEEESRLMDQLLHDLRLRYLHKTRASCEKTQ